MEIEKITNPHVHMLKCCYEIMRRLDFILEKKSNNKAGVRHSCGNPIVEMLCKFFNYKLVLEDTMNNRADKVMTSWSSKADYLIYSLMKDTKGKETVN